MKVAMNDIGNITSDMVRGHLQILLLILGESKRIN